MKRSMRASRAGAKRGWVCAGRRADATESRATARSRVRCMRDLNGFLAQRRTGNFGAAPLVLGVGRCYSPNPAGGRLMVASTVVSQILTRWAHLYGRTPVSATLTYLHLVGILVGGGVAVAADRASLRLSPATPDWSNELTRLAGVHRWVVAGLALIFASGVLMMLAELDSVATSVVFWTKMGLIALLLGNGYVRMRAENALQQGLAAGWRRFRRASVASLVLWLVVLFAGTLLHPTILCRPGLGSRPRGRRHYSRRNTRSGRRVSDIEGHCYHTLAGGESRMSYTHAPSVRNARALLLAAVALAGAPAHPAPGDPAAVRAKLSEWKVELSQRTIAAGTVTFTVANVGSIPHAFEVEGQGIEQETPVIQILPGPFPFPDSAAPILKQFGDEREGLESQVKNGPYSNNVTPISGAFTFTAWDKGAVRDSVDGVAEFRTQDGARWRLALDRVQTKDVPHHPRFGGVILGLYYHGNTAVHTPLVLTIISAVALWAFGHLY